MSTRIAAVCVAFAASAVSALAATTSATPPKAGPVQIMKSSELKPGMMATAWTVFAGTEPEAVPVEIIGLWKNAWGPKQDAIIARMWRQRAADQRRGRDERQSHNLDERRRPASGIADATRQP